MKNILHKKILGKRFLAVIINSPNYLSLKSFKEVLRNLVRLAPKALYPDPKIIYVSHCKCAGSHVAAKVWCEFDSTRFKTFVDKHMELPKEGSL